MNTLPTITRRAIPDETRNNLDETQEIYYPAVIAAIRDTGYDGYVGHEFIPVGDPVEALKNALQVCTI